MTARAPLFAALLLAAAPLQAQDAEPAPAVQQIATAEVGVMPEGMGQVVFFRPSRFMGAALGCTVRENGAQLARLGNGKYFAVNFAPGAHQFMVESEAKDVLNIEVEPGTTSYVRCAIGMGVMVGRPNISPSDKAEWDKHSGKLKPWTPKGAKDEDAK